MIIDDKYTVHSVNTSLVQIDILIEFVRISELFFYPALLTGIAIPMPAAFYLDVKNIT